MSADGELNRQQWNPDSGFNFGIPQQGQQGSYSIQGQLCMNMLSKWFLIFSGVLSLNNVSIAILLLHHLQNSPWTFLLLILHTKSGCGSFIELVASKINKLKH